MELLEVLKRRRDTRHFLTDTFDFSIIEKGIELSNDAPSVGLTNPTRFIIIETDKAKNKVKSNFDEVNKLAQKSISNDSLKEQYDNLKLEGILQAPIGMIVCYDTAVLEKFSIGTITKPKEMLIASVSCAIHTFWLYITSKGLSLGWVSILDFEKLKSDFELPETFQPLGYFCVGKPATNYNGNPMLVQTKWAEKSTHKIYRF